MSYEFTISELFAAHEPVLGERDAHTLAETLGVDRPSRPDDPPLESVLIFASSLALLACLSDETAAKVERFRSAAAARDGRALISDADWHEFVAQTRAWRDAGFPPNRAPPSPRTA